MKKFTAIVIIFMTFFLMSASSVYADVIADELSLETNIIQNFSAYDSSGWIFYNYKAGNRGGDWDPQLGALEHPDAVISRYFLPDPSDASRAYIYQKIDLTNPYIQKLINDGQLYFNSSFYFYGPHDSDEDYGRGFVYIDDSNNHTIKQWLVDTKNWWSMVRNDPRWYKYSFCDLDTLPGGWNKIPAGAKSITVELDAANKVGSNMDAYFDDIVLILGDKKPPQITDVAALDSVSSNEISNINKHFPDREIEYMNENLWRPINIELRFDEPVRIAKGSHLKLNIVDKDGNPVYAEFDGSTTAKQSVYFKYTPSPGHKLIDYDRIVAVGFEGTATDSNDGNNKWNNVLPRPTDTTLYKGSGTVKPLALDLSKPIAVIDYSGEDTFKLRHDGITLKHENIPGDYNSPEFVYKYAWYDADTDSKLSGDTFSYNTATASTPDDGKHNYKLKLWVYDMAWNEGYKEMTFIQKDTDGPQVNCIPESSIDLYKKGSTVEIKVTDVLSGLHDNKQIYYKWTSTADLSAVSIADCDIADEYELTTGDDGIQTIKTTISTPEGANGAYYLHVFADDKRNNRTHYVSGQFLLDNEGPVIDIESSTRISKDSPIEITAVVTDSLLGEVDAASLYYQLIVKGEDPEIYPYNWQPFVSGVPFSVSNNSNGYYELCMKAKDKLGNSSDIARYMLIFDYQKPDISITALNPNRLTGYGSDCDMKVQVWDPALSGSYSFDTSSGIDLSSWYYQWSENPLPDDNNWKPCSGSGETRIIKAEPDLEGEYYFITKVSDNLGNTKILATDAKYKIDSRPPRISIDANGSDGQLVGQINTNVTLSDRYGTRITMSYNHSKSNTVQPDKFLNYGTHTVYINDFSEDGEWYVWIRAEDVCGNAGIAVSKAYLVENQPPRGSIAFSQQYTSKLDNEVKMTVDDPEALMSLSNNKTTWTEWEPFNPVKAWTLEFDADGAYKVYIKYKDKLENTSPIYEASITLDKTPPMGSIEYSTPATEITSGDVTATLITEDASPVTLLNNGGSFEYVFEKNGEFEFIFQDAAGNIGRAKASVSNIDKTPPKAKLTYSDSLAEWTVKPISCTIELDDSEAVITSEGGAVHTFNENGEFTFEFADKAGNTGSAVAAVYNIDRTPPAGTIIYSTKEASSSPVTVYLETDEPVTVTNNGGSIQRIFTGNGEFIFEFADKAGNTGSAAATVSNINEALPAFDINYSASSWTKDDITVTYSVYHDDDIQIISPIEGKDYIYTFSDNGILPVTAEYISTGKEGTATGAVYNIDRTPPAAVYVHYSNKDLTDEPVYVTILPSDDKSASITILNNGGSSTREFTSNGQFTFEFQDEAGNIGTETVEVNNITSEIPVPELIYSTTEPTFGSVTVTLDFGEYSYPIEILNNNGKNIYTFLENGEFTFDYMYGGGKTGSIKAAVSNIETDAADTQIQYYYSGEEIPLTEGDMNIYTVRNIVARISSTDASMKILNNGGSKDYEFTQNGYFDFIYEDSKGLRGHKTAYVNNIDKAPPKAYVKNYNEGPTCGAVYISVTFSEPVEVFDQNFEIGGETYKDGKIISFNISCSENGTYSAKLRDRAGNSSTMSFEVNNIDKVFEPYIIYSTKEPTNQDVTAIVAANEPVIMQFSNEENYYTFSHNGTHNFYVQDIAGNKKTMIAEVNNIDKAVPELYLNYSDTMPTNHPVTVTVSANEEIVAKNNNQQLARIFTQNGSFTFEVEDLAGNKASIKAAVNNIDTEAPRLILNGQSAIVIPLGSSYEEMGAVAADNINGDLTGSIVVDGKVTESEEGDYVLTYKVADQVGNSASVQRYVKVVSQNNLNIFVNGKILEGQSISVDTPQIQFKYFGQQGTTEVKWTEGWHEEGFFKTGGKLLEERSIIEAAKSGWYTVLLQDQERNTRLVYIYYSGISR